VRSVKTPYGDDSCTFGFRFRLRLFLPWRPTWDLSSSSAEPLEAANQKVLAYTLNTEISRCCEYYRSSRLLRPPQGFWDTDVTGVTRFDAKYEYSDGRVDSARPVVAIFYDGPSHLNVRMFSSVGDSDSSNVYTLGVLAVVFFSARIAALVTGVVLTRRITSAVRFSTTQRYSSRTATIRIASNRSRDQLGILGESFIK